MTNDTDKQNTLPSTTDPENSLPLENSQINNEAISINEIKTLIGSVGDEVGKYHTTSSENMIKIFREFLKIWYFLGILVFIVVLALIYKDQFSYAAGLVSHIAALMAGYFAGNKTST